MLKLFKNKSLKDNTKTRENAGAGVRGAGEQGADNKNAKKQRGRSMVEMLGVLAIIGVLSIGGIQGYTMAMRRYRANEIVDAVNKYAMTIYSSCQTFLLQNSFKHSYGINACDPNYGFEIINFTDAGLGPLPSGVIDVASNGYDENALTNGYATFLINPNMMDWSGSENSNDIVEISIMLDNQQVCQVISEMLDEKSRGKVQRGEYHPCEKTTMNGKTGYPAHLAFYVS